MIIVFWKRFRIRRLARHDAENDRRSNGVSALELSVEHFSREYENRRNDLVSAWRTRKLLPVYRRLRARHEKIMLDQGELKQHPTTMERLTCENEIIRNEEDRKSLETLRKKINNYESEEFSLREINKKLSQNNEERESLLKEHKNILEREKKEKEPLNQKLTSDCARWRKLDNKWQRRESYFDEKLEALRAKYAGEYEYYRQCYKTYRPRKLEAKSFVERCRTLGIDNVGAKTLLSEENGEIKSWRQDVTPFLKQ